MKKKKNPKTRQLELGRQYRSFNLKRESINEEERTVELSFSSEYPVRRYWGYEILSHKDGECDLTRLNNAGAFLMDHILSDQRGVVEKAWIEGTTGRAIVRLSKNERGEELLQDIKDLIRTKISVGYDLVEVLDAWEENGEEYYRFKWEPYEISSVSVEADVTVGVGRSEDTKNKKTFNVQFRGTQVEDEDILEEQEEQGTEENGQRSAATVSGGQPSANGNDDPVAAERLRCQEIQQLGEQFGMGRQAAEAVANNVPAEAFRKDVLKHVRSQKAKPAGTEMNLGLTDKEVERYSLLSAIRANITGNWRKAGFEREVSVALAEKAGKDSRGFMVNYEVLGNMGRSQDTKTSVAGGALVADELHSEQFIELLRPHSMAAQLGVRFVTGLVGNVDIPKLLSGSSFFWIDEGDDAPDTNVSFGIVKMSPKTVAGSVPITRRLMAQSTPDVDLMIRDDMLQGLGLEIDKAIFVGTGTGFEPLGIVNQSGVNAIDLNTLNLSHAGLVAFETAIENADVMSGNIQYTCNANTKGTLKTTPRNANSDKYLWEKNELNEYPAHMLKWLPDNAALAGDFRQAMFGTWGVLDLMVDKSTKAASGGTVLRVFQDGDVATRQPKAFAYGQKTV